MSDPLDAAAFGTLLRERFPEMRPDLDDGISTGLVHLEMAELARATEAAIRRHDYSKLKSYYEVADIAFVFGTEDVQNAVSVSFLETVFLYEEPNEEVEGMMPVPLRDELRKMREALQA